MTDKPAGQDSTDWVGLLLAVLAVLVFVLGVVVVVLLALERQWLILAITAMVCSPLAVLLYLYVGPGSFILDRHGRPVSGRDADRYARYRARLSPWQRRALDETITDLDRGDADE